MLHIPSTQVVSICEKLFPKLEDVHVWSNRITRLDGKEAADADAGGEGKVVPDDTLC